MVSTYTAIKSDVSRLVYDLFSCFAVNFIFNIQWIRHRIRRRLKCTKSRLKSGEQNVIESKNRHNFCYSSCETLALDITTDPTVHESCIYCVQNEPKIRVFYKIFKLFAKQMSNYWETSEQLKRLLTGVRHSDALLISSIGSIGSSQLDFGTVLSKHSVL